MTDDQTSGVVWTAEDTCQVGQVTFVCRPFRNRPPSTPEVFCIVKPPWSVRRYAELLATLAPSVVLEVGLFDGGSTAFVHQVAQPDRIVALDLSPLRTDALPRYIARHGLDDQICLRTGIDQADRAGMAAVLTGTLPPGLPRPLDLVIDDASHLVDASRTTFEVAFPLLRPGGLYVLEDWSWGLGERDYRAEEQLLAALVFELVLASARHRDVIAEVRIQQGWAVVERGPAPLDPDDFDLRALINRRGQGLLPTPPG